MHRTIFTHIFFGTKQNKQRENCTHRLHQKNTHRNFCTQKLYPKQSLHGSFFFRTEIFPFRLVFNAQQFLQTDGFYTESSPHRSLTHRRFYAQHFLHTDALIHRCLYTEDELYTETCAHSTLLHATNFYTERFCFPFLITFRVPPLKCFSQGLTLAIFYGNPLLVSFNRFNAGNVADLSSVDPGLVDVQEVQSSSSAFAAILANGKVVAWGDFEGGGEMTQGAEMQR